MKIERTYRVEIKSLMKGTPKLFIMGNVRPKIAQAIKEIIKAEEGSSFGTNTEIEAIRIIYKQ